MPPGHGHTPKETFCMENVLPGEVASEEIDDKGKIAFRELYSRRILGSRPHRAWGGGRRRGGGRELGYMYM